MNHGVLLTQAAGGSPVWRLIIIDPTKNATAFGPNQIPDADASNLVIERTVYFVPNPQGAGAGGAVYSPSATVPLVIAPGQYAVIGSGESPVLYPTTPNPKQTLIGLSGQPTQVAARTGAYIDLSGASNPVLQNGAAAAAGPPPVVLAIDTPQRLSVSEPAGVGYTALESANNVTYNPATESESQVIDVPWIGSAIRRPGWEGTSRGFRGI